MSIEIKVPDLGDGVDSGDVLEILVREGETIRKDQGIVELETDKATVEIPSTHAGRVTRILVDVGQSVAVGAALISLDAGEAGKAEEKAAAPSKAAPPTAAAKAEPAEKPKAEKPKPAAAKAKPAVEPKAAPADDADDEVEPQTPKKKAAAPAAGKPAQPPAAVAPAASDESGEIAAGPAIRRFAREVGVDLRRVKGSGEGGRITREDVLEAVRQASQQAAAAAPPAATGPGSPSSDNWGPVRIERMSKIRRTIAAQMHKSWEACPRVTNFDDADVTELERIRVSSKADYAARGVRLSSMPFVIKSVAMALKNNPVLNASVDIDNGMIVYKDYVNIGIAVDTDRGLVVPVLRHADRMSFPEVARALSTIAENARNNEFSVDDLRGGTFSISNLGAIGGAYSTPIINVPEVAILLVGRSRKMPRVVENDQIAVRLVMPLSLAYDHRLVDGAAAARFLNEVIGYLEAPARLLLAP
ncbi:MAG: 2-oxo acid dehydrogenase subunit E2 [Pirellulaceae bacterium]|nr:2-oxo acid dehydrogenase subunit E2 [Pirellulaceae bacterium]